MDPRTSSTGGAASTSKPTRISGLVKADGRRAIPSLKDFVKILDPSTISLTLTRSEDDTLVVYLTGFPKNKAQCPGAVEARSKTTSSIPTAEAISLKALGEALITTARVSANSKLTRTATTHGALALCVLDALKKEVGVFRHEWYRDDSNALNMTLFETGLDWKVILEKVKVTQPAFVVDATPMEWSRLTAGIQQTVVREGQGVRPADVEEEVPALTAQEMDAMRFLNSKAAAEDGADPLFGPVHDNHADSLFGEGHDSDNDSLFGPVDHEDGDLLFGDAADEHEHEQVEAPELQEQTSGAAEAGEFVQTACANESKSTGEELNDSHFESPAAEYAHPGDDLLQNDAIPAIDLPQPPVQEHAAQAEDSLDRFDPGILDKQEAYYEQNPQYLQQDTEALARNGDWTEGWSGFMDEFGDDAYVPLNTNYTSDEQVLGGDFEPSGLGQSDVDGHEGYDFSFNNAYTSNFNDEEVLGGFVSFDVGHSNTAPGQVGFIYSFDPAAENINNDFNNVFQQQPVQAAEPVEQSQPATASPAAAPPAAASREVSPSPGIGEKHPRSNSDDEEAWLRAGQGIGRGVKAPRIDSVVEPPVPPTPPAVLAAPAVQSRLPVRIPTWKRQAAAGVYIHSNIAPKPQSSAASSFVSSDAHSPVYGGPAGVVQNYGALQPDASSILDSAASSFVSPGSPPPVYGGPAAPMQSHNGPDSSVTNSSSGFASSFISPQTQAPVYGVSPPVVPNHGGWRSTFEITDDDEVKETIDLTDGDDDVVKKNDLQRQREDSAVDMSIAPASVAQTTVSNAKILKRKADGEREVPKNKRARLGNDTAEGQATSQNASTSQKTNLSANSVAPTKVRKGTKLRPPYTKCPMKLEWDVGNYQTHSEESYASISEDKKSLNFYEMFTEQITATNGKQETVYRCAEQPYLTVPTAAIKDVTMCRKDGHIMLTRHNEKTLILDFTDQVGPPLHILFLTTLAPLGNDGKGTEDYQHDQAIRAARTTKHTTKYTVFYLRDQFHTYGTNDWKGATKKEMKKWLHWANEVYNDPSELRGLSNETKDEIQNAIIAWLMTNPTEGVDPATGPRIYDLVPLYVDRVYIGHFRTQEESFQFYQEGLFGLAGNGDVE